MRNVSRKNKVSPQPEDGIPLITLVFMMSGFLLGYLLGEILLALRPHPVHWLAGVVVMAAGYTVGRFVYRRHGDVI